MTLADLRPRTVASLRGGAGTNGVNGANGPTGAAGTNGLGGTNGSNGAIGPGGPNGADGTDGTDGTNGADGVLGPLSTTAGLTALPTATPPTTVVSLTVPAGNYVVFAKTQLMHTGAGDSVTCQLKAGAATIDESSIKTLPRTRRGPGRAAGRDRDVADAVERAVRRHHGERVRGLHESDRPPGELASRRPRVIAQSTGMRYRPHSGRNR